MSYNYETEKPYILTDEGQREFLKARDWVKEILETAGAFQMGHFMSNGPLSGESWKMLAMIDRLVELGELRETLYADCAAQHRVFIASKN